MPSKAFKLAESIVSNPVMNDIVTNTTAVPATITTQIATSTDQGVSTVDDLPDTGNNPGDIQLVEATNRLYVWNGSGWYNIALINTSPTWDSGGQPLSTYALDADSPQDATVITLAASDPEGIPISYSYVTSGSMDSIATVSQDSSVFTITPKTVTEVGEGVELTGSITFRASDGVNILPSVSSFTLSFVTTIENSKYTTLLATATDTSDNNNITDSSTNNHTITVNGDAHAGTFSPYRHGGYSWDFEGGTNAVSGQVTEGEGIVANNNSSDYNVGTNDYSIECWFKHRTSTTYTTNENFRICEFNDIPNGGSNDRISLQYKNDGNINVKENGSVVVATTSTPCDGEWHFIQVIRTGGTTAVYIDGTQEASASSSTNIGAISRIVVGAWYEYNYGFDGQIADFRFSNTARTAGVPTERLTSDSNTKLLVCSKPYLVDESSTATSLLLRSSSNRDKPKAAPIGPYDHNEYSASDNGGSAYFDGSGDYLSLPAAPTLGTSDFEISMWLYPKTISGDDVIIDFRPASTNGSYINLLLSSGIPKLHVNGDQITGSSALTVNNWSYLTLTRVSGSTKLYVNGTQSGSTYSDSNNYLTGSSRPVIGQAGYNPSLNLGFNGYMSDLVVKLSGNSSPSIPTAPVSSSGTSLHIKGTDASIIDKSQTGNMKVFGTATGSSAEAKFANTKSMYFPGSNPNHIRHYSQIYLPGELTIECWVNTSDFNSGYVWCLENYQLEMRINSNGTGVDIYDSGYINFSRAAGGMSTGTWYHIAVCRDSSNVFRAWIDGIRSTQSGTKTTTYDKDHIVIGGEYSSATSINWPYHGYVQDLRISNYARYSAADETANIPTEPLKG